ncbi:hypothetical protein DFH09DRAFT_1140004, partial [Mycena vulgaris]
SSHLPSFFFGPYDTHQPVPLGNSASPRTQTSRSMWSVVGTSSDGAASQRPLNIEQNMSPPSSNSHISLDDFTQLNQQLEYIDEHDEHGDIAAGDQAINGSLVDEVFDTLESNMTTAEVETQASEASPNSAVHKQLLSVRKRLTEEIKRYGTTLCCRRGDFYDRPTHPVFALQRSLNPTQLYSREVFIWLPYLLPGCPDRFRSQLQLPSPPRMRLPPSRCM